jgi:hypothetical protein
MADPDVAAAIAALNQSVRALAHEIAALREALEERGLADPPRGRSTPDGRCCR